MGQALGTLVASLFIACTGSREPASPAQAPSTEPAVAVAAAPVATAFPSDAEIERMLAERQGEGAATWGVVVGLIEPGRRRVLSHGSRALGDTGPLDGDTVFEIGSMTKVFTSLLLAEAVVRKELSLGDPVSKFLPGGVHVPERGGRVITLVDLATHTSGLPSLPGNFKPADPQNPYADYTLEQLYEALPELELQSDIGEKYAYSNLGVGLLGHALERRAGQDYDALVRARVTGPLGMASTGITLSPALRARLALGHDEALKPAKNWDLPTLAGAGALRSTANDMLIFLSAAIGDVSTPLAPAFAAMHGVQRPTDDDNTVIELGWHVSRVHGKQIVGHGGGTGGYRTYMGYDPGRRLGVVVLSNWGNPAGVEDIGRHLLDPELPLIGAVPRGGRTAVAVDPRVFDGYVGYYQLASGGVFHVTRQGDQLLVQLSGQSSMPVFPESEAEYFYRAVDAQLTFVRDEQGKANALVLHQNGRNLRAPRIERQERKAIALDAATFDRYVGRYQLAPGAVLSVTRQDSHFFVQLTGQPPAEIFAEGEREFFLQVVDAQLSFELDPRGKATAVVLHQGGKDQRAPKLE